MAKLNMLCIKITYLNELLDNHVLFAHNDAEDLYLRMKGYEINDIKMIEPAIISSLQAPDNISCLKSDETYAGKGLITCSDSAELVINNFPVKFSLSYIKGKVSNKVLIKMDGYALSLFLHCLNLSQSYVQCVSRHFVKLLPNVKRIKTERVLLMLSGFQIILLEPERHVMDLIWAKMACQAIHELRQLQYAMSWLSTLGGAYSALGEGKETCAKKAGLISLEQLRIALKLGNDIIISQCKLYFSLSLVQQGHCRVAKEIIQQQYSSLKNSSVGDIRTLNMCKGIWARLKYELYRRRETKRKAMSYPYSINDNKQRNTKGLALLS